MWKVKKDETNTTTIPVLSEEAPPPNEPLAVTDRVNDTNDQSQDKPAVPQIVVETAPVNSSVPIIEKEKVAVTVKARSRPIRATRSRGGGERLTYVLCFEIDCNP